MNLLSVIDEMAGTFSGGMKRRLSVAISMIGNPLCCYLVPPPPFPGRTRIGSKMCPPLCLPRDPT